MRDNIESIANEFRPICRNKRIDTAEGSHFDSVEVRDSIHQINNQKKYTEQLIQRLVANSSIVSN